jgi:hypothetical protein
MMPGRWAFATAFHTPTPWTNSACKRAIVRRHQFDADHVLDLQLEFIVFLSILHSAGDLLNV